MDYEKEIKELKQRIKQLEDVFGDKQIEILSVAVRTATSKRIKPQEAAKYKKMANELKTLYLLVKNYSEGEQGDGIQV